MELSKEPFKNTILRIPAFWLVFTIALIIRLIYLCFNIADYWGDAYHNVFISRSIVENGWVYSDFSGREVVWLPFYRYLVTFFMFIFDEYSLIIPHFINGIIGAFTCAFVTSIVGNVTIRKVAVFSGIILAILPWHIAYSNINTPEVLSGFLIVLTIYLWKSKNLFWIIPTVFIGVLTRNEVTLLLAIFGIYLMVKRDWKPAMAMLTGASIGLLIWGAWCYSQTGHFFWWISERSLGSSWNHLFQLQQGRSLGKWYFPILSIIQAFPFLLIFILIPSLLKSIYQKKQVSVNSLLVPVGIILLFDWFFVFLMQFQFYSYPEPKYFIITLPLACAALGYIFGTIAEIKLNRMINITLIFGVVLLMVQTPVFNYLHYQDHPSKSLGLYMKNNLGKEGSIWIDHTIAWYYSEVDFKRIHSSYKLAPRPDKYQDGFEEELRKKFDKLDIRYIISQPASFTYVFNIWPEMKSDKAFEWKGLTFSPIYTYERPKYDEGSNISDKIKDLIIPKDVTASIWSVE